MYFDVYYLKQKNRKVHNFQFFMPSLLNEVLDKVHIVIWMIMMMGQEMAESTHDTDQKFIQNFGQKA
jgi:hypothetical protein